MTSAKYKNSGFFFTALIFMLILSITAHAQKPVSETAIQNLITGINSPNEGLRRSAIYYAGKYEYEETADALAAQLIKEQDPNTRLLIANALFRIGDPTAMECVYEIAQTDTNAKVRRIAGAIYEAFIVVDKSQLDSKLAKK